MTIIFSALLWTGIAKDSKPSIVALTTLRVEVVSPELIAGRVVDGNFSEIVRRSVIKREHCAVVPKPKLDAQIKRIADVLCRPSVHGDQCLIPTKNWRIYCRASCALHHSPRSERNEQKDVASVKIHWEDFD